MLSPRNGLPLPDPDLCYARMVAHTKACVDCQLGRPCADGAALLKTWGDADRDLQIIEADLDAQLRDGTSGE